jgi:hypothetical protein
MGTQWRSIPGRVILTALALLAVASFTGFLARPAAGVPILPAEVESRGPRRIALVSAQNGAVAVTAAAREAGMTPYRESRVRARRRLHPRIPPP